MKGSLRFENEYDIDCPLLIDRYSDGYAVFQIGGTPVAHPVSLSPSQVSDLVAFLTKGAEL
ncbi:hypothetical protein BW14_02305 [Bifidobacterium sp. UTBIF-68]|uniref:hypothetical protein n=1 Tax=Bifidobacterium sp. UTBIF-68 TaxID=1465262 RepID=UPI0011265BC6|nr:hypothetical protein [Bifidobacterium sp. UTBIF-68]TPF94321.1 hypothetical protein BW14_02305 [Bifidobacterium sp. UTBIF-68]